MKSTRRAAGLFSLIAIFLLLAPACSGESREELTVTATAYNSLPAQTSGDPNVAAWGDTLEPGMLAIAVSRDLIPLGLTRGVAVRIEGLPGEFCQHDFGQCGDGQLRFGAEFMQRTHCAIAHVPVCILQQANEIGSGVTRGRADVSERIGCLRANCRQFVRQHTN